MLIVRYRAILIKRLSMKFVLTNFDCSEYSNRAIGDAYGRCLRRCWDSSFVLPLFVDLHFLSPIPNPIGFQLCPFYVFCSHIPLNPSDHWGDYAMKMNRYNSHRQIQQLKYFVYNFKFRIKKKVFFSLPGIFSSLRTSRLLAMAIAMIRRSLSS